MSDSLRDQLLKAGFAPPAQTRKKPGKKTGKHRAPASSATPQTPPAKPVQTPPVKDAQTQPLAGHTHVPAVKPKKQKSRKPPVVKPRSGSWGTRQHTDNAGTASNTARSARNQQHQETRERIRKLIENAELKNFKGEEIYRFTLKNKIRELMVSDAIRKQLVSGELAITRLDGATRLVPCATATDIRQQDAQWLVFMATDVADSGSDEDDEFPIPDDLIW